jgi:hypothetical protein
VFAIDYPVLGLALLGALALTSIWQPPDWRLLPEGIRSSVFLLSLVLCAYMMPRQSLPDAQWYVVLVLGAVSAFVDNVPLTALAIKENGYDWAMLAYAVGFGGSMIWFGSSAGVALSMVEPGIKNVRLWVKGGWSVILAFFLGFLVMYCIMGWRPVTLQPVPTGSVPACGAAHFAGALAPP